MCSIKRHIKMNEDAYRRFTERQEKTEEEKEYDLLCPICENMLIVHSDGEVEVVSG